MSRLYKLHYLFFAGDAAELCGVHRSTVNRWLHSGELYGRQAANGHWLIPLESINEKRADYSLKELDESDIDHYWGTGEVTFELEDDSTKEPLT